MDFFEEYEKEMDPDIIYKYDILQKYHEAYEILNDAGALYCNNYTLYGNESGIKVNKNYIKKYPVKDVEGNWINFDEIDADVIYLVPEYYLNKLPDRFYETDHPEGETTQMLVISNEQNIFDFALPEYEFVKRPYLITLYKDTAFSLDKSIFGCVYVDGDISELLKDTIFHDKIVISAYKNLTDQVRAYYMKNIYREARVVIPVLILILLIILQYAYLYSKEYNKRLFIKNMLGHSPFSIYFGLLLESGFAVLAAFIVAVLRKTNVYLFSFVLILDILVYTTFVLLSQKVNTKQTDIEEFYHCKPIVCMLS